jgi:hypothetical protein
MRISSANPKSIVSLATAALASLALAGLPAHAEDATATGTKPYEWSAQLISYDAETNTAVLKAHVASHVAIAGLDSYSEGDRLILTWSGRSWASGVRGLTRDPELTPDSLSLPVEFVAAEMDGRYVSFRIPVPESAVELISGMETGHRVTGTSPRMATDWHNSVSSLRHYNDVD